VRPGGKFFTAPNHTTHRRYEALRAYLVDGEPAAVVAQRFGYTPASLNSAVRDFRAGGREFFLTPTSGPKSAPGKDAARSRIVELRTDGHSIDEIAVALAAQGLALNRTGIAEVIAEQGLPRLWRRPAAARGGPRREVLPRAERGRLRPAAGPVADEHGRVAAGHPGPAGPGPARPRPGGAGGGVPVVAGVHRHQPTPGDRLVFHIFGSLAEFERDLIRSAPWPDSPRPAGGVGSGAGRR